MKKSLHELVGHKIEHVIFGDCEVVEVVNLEEGKFVGKVLDQNVKKTLIFSSNFYKNIEDYESIELPIYQKRVKRTYKPVDTSKFGKHPFVKALDWKLAKQRQQLVDSDLYEDDIDEEEE